MTRKSKGFKRKIKLDKKYSSELVTRLINKVMLDGKKTISENIVYNSMDILSKKVNEEPLKALETVIKQASPLMEVRSRRVGGSTYQVPVEVRYERSITLALRWIVNFSRNKKGMNMIDSLSSELIDIYNNTGLTIKKREDTHKMAESNKAFSHFRW